jgi:hypothetical protein
MKTLIHEIGVIDKQGNKHPVNFKKGLNIKSLGVRSNIPTLKTFLLTLVI